MNINQKNDNEKSMIAFPLDQEKFCDFITSLLGKPQTITKTLSGSFEIELNDLINFYHLIDQRITQQNKSKLIQFTVKIIYSDDSSILLGSIEELKTYNEIRPIDSIAVHLNFQYIVIFEDKKIPEKQDIEISIISSEQRIKPRFEDDEMPYVIMGSSGFINFRIKHTARTWGADIESLLSNHINNILKPKSKFKHFIRKHDEKISIIFAIFFIISLFIGGFISTNIFTNKLSNQLEITFNKIKGNDIEIINSKINFISQFIVSNFWSKYYFYVIIFLISGIVISILLAIWISSSLSIYDTSYILLTKESIKFKEKIEKKIFLKWMSFIFSIITTIITSFVANLLFFILLKPN